MFAGSGMCRAFAGSGVCGALACSGMCGAVVCCCLRCVWSVGVFAGLLLCVLDVKTPAVALKD